MEIILLLNLLLNVLGVITVCYLENLPKDEVKKQQEMLKELNSKREQLKMLLDWKEELLNFIEKFKKLE